MWTPQVLPSSHPHSFVIQIPAQKEKGIYLNPIQHLLLQTLSSFVLSVGLSGLLATQKSFSLSPPSTVPTSYYPPNPPKKNTCIFPT